MTILIAALAFGVQPPTIAASFEITAPLPSAAQDWATLGEITAFGQQDPDGRKLPPRQVPIKFPTGAIPGVPDTDPYVQWGERKIALNKWGNLGRVYQGKGGWDEFKTMYAQAQQRIKSGGATVWKCKAVIFTRTNALYKNADGVLESQQASMTDEDVQFCLETFARYEAAIEAFTGGAVDIQLTISKEDEPVVASYQKDEVWAFGPPETGEQYLRGRFNRGDFDSILYMYHPANARAYSFGGTLWRTNNATQAYVILSNGREGGQRIGHTEAMVHEWYHQIEDTYSKYGYGGWENSWLPELHGAGQNGYTTDTAGYSGWFSWLRDIMTFSVTQGMWAKLKNRSEPDWIAVRTQTHPSEGKLYRWEDVKDDPWAKLPYLTSNDLAKRIGAASVEIKSADSQVLFLPSGANPTSEILPQIDTEDFSLNNELNFTKEAAARITAGGRDLLFVRFDIADFFISRLADHATQTPAPANVLGYINIGAKMMVVVDTKLNNDTTAELNLLNLGSEKSSVVALGKASFLRGEPLTASFFTDTPDSRFSVLDWDGNAVPFTDGGLSVQGPGTHILRVVAALPSGERVERPFVVRTLEPVDVDVSAVGTPRVSGSAHKFQITLTNHGGPRTVSISATLPSGWSSAPLTDVQLAANEKKTVIGDVQVPASAPDGPYEIAIETRVQGSPGAVRVGRLALEKVTKPTLISNTFEAGTEGWETPRADNSGWKVETAAGGVEGNCLVITDRGGTHWGRVNAFGGYKPDGSRDPSFPGYDASAYPYLDFQLKTKSENTLALVVTLSDGNRYVAMLTGRYQEQWGESKQLPRAKFIPNGEWQRVVYDLNSALDSAAGPGPQVVVDIGLGDSRQFSSNQWWNDNTATYYVDSFHIAREASAADNTTQTDPDSEISLNSSPTSANPEDRARAAAAISAESTPEQLAAILPLLNDPASKVRLNAAAAFARAKYPAGVPALAEAAKLERDGYTGVFLVRALEFQDAPESWAAMAAMVRQSRAEEMPIAEAALAMGRKGDPKFVRDIMLTLTGHSWQTRRDGVKALAMINAPEAQRSMMVFLQEVDPMVRLEVARGAKVDIEPVGRRMEWGSINDLSDVVRAYCYAALTKSADPVRRSRGYAGLKEANADIRRIIAEEMGNDSKEHHVQPLLGLVSDPNPEVRGAAVRSLLNMPGTRDFSEMSALASEDYEEVIFPLLEAAKAKKLTLPNAMLERLAKHRNPDVRKLVKEIAP